MDPVDGNDEQNKGPVPSKDDQIRRTRRKKQQDPSSQEETEVTDRQLTARKLTQVKELNAAAAAAAAALVAVEKEKVLKGKAGCKQKLSQIMNKEKINKNKPRRMKATEEVHEEMEEEQDKVPNEDRAEQSGSLNPTKRDHCLGTGDHVFQKIYPSTSAEKPSSTPVPASHRELREHLSTAESKRRRKPPDIWWLDGSSTEEGENLTPQPQPKEPRLEKGRKKQSRPSKSGTPVKCSLDTFKDIFTLSPETPTFLSSRGAGQINTPMVTMIDAPVPDEGVRKVLSMEPEEVYLQHGSPQEGTFPSVNRSGLSSMIELQEYEDDNSEVHETLSASDLCAPPLKPLVLQPMDRANLTEWFKYLWPATVDSGPGMSPDQFDWYFHRDRAIGFLEDLNCGTICNGKMLLGSYMKKPLWVDHSATSVFNLFTSLVSVIINGRESRYSPGQSFMVPCGHAYSIENIFGQPAMLCFTRISAESLD